MYARLIEFYRFDLSGDSIPPITRKNFRAGIPDCPKVTVSEMFFVQITFQMYDLFPYYYQGNRTKESMTEAVFHDHSVIYLYMQKQGIKTPPTRRINIPAPPERSRIDPGLHLSRTRVSAVGTPGSQAALQAVFDKRKACLDEKRSRFNIFCTCSRTVSVFIV